jgi:formylglycine-generating enzyme required for sulfatase activity
MADLDIRYLPVELQAIQLIDFRQRSRDQLRFLRDSVHNLPSAPELPGNAIELAPNAPLDPVAVLFDQITHLSTDVNQQRRIILEIEDLSDIPSFQTYIPELFERLIRRTDILTEDNRRYLQASQAYLKTPQIEIVSQSASIQIRKNSVELLPTPFAWIDIRSKDYCITKYPITNAQFAVFIEAGGYRERQWWTEDGWEAREQGWDWTTKFTNREWKASGNPWIQPRYWNPKPLNMDHPVVGVSWYEAVAFCMWLSAVTNESITLPTEEQWQYAAQGDTERAYPWGNVWDKARCNNSVGKNDINMTTTPVRQYEGLGDSPHGVIDMAGNVWEWCLTDFDKKTNNKNSAAQKRVLRGGSLNSRNIDSFRVSHRNWAAPNFCDYHDGFRCVRTI